MRKSNSMVLFRARIAFDLKTNKTVGYFLKIQRHLVSEVQGELDLVIHLHEMTSVLRRGTLKCFSAVERFI